jgi:hypothetical protein
VSREGISVKYWLDISIRSVDKDAAPIINESLGVQTIEAAFYEAQEILDLAKEKWEEGNA